MAELEAEPGRADRIRGVTESIDTTTPGGKLVFHIFGALAKKHYFLTGPASSVTS